MFKTIMVPIDLSHLDEGKATIGLAKAHAEKGARIIILNVVEDIPSYVAAELPNGLVDRSREHAREELATLVKSTGIKADIEVRTGHPYRTILEAAEGSNADLIVIASHQPGLQDYFLGSTAARVVRHAKCSVLVVR
jgi:universal stress protein F